MNSLVSVASLASASAVAAPSIAAASSPIDRDPIFAAIAEHRSLHEKYLRLCRDRDELWERLPERAKAKPFVALCPQRDSGATIIEQSENHTIVRHDWGALNGRYYVATRISEIEHNATMIPEEHREDWIANRIGALQRHTRRIARVKSKVGFTRAARLCFEAMDDLYNCGQKLLTTQPTTIAGVVALVAYALSNRDCDQGQGMMPDEADRDTLLETVKWALGAHVPDEIARSMPAIG